MSLPTQNKKRINITITGDDAELMEQLKNRINNKLMMNLSMAQIVKRLVRQATVEENNNNV